MSRRSARIEANRKYCSFHQNQSNLEEEMALCGLLAFNDSLHSEVLTYMECMETAMKWVNTSDETDKKLRLVADNEGRGAFSVDILKVVLEKNGYSLFNVFRRQQRRNHSYVIPLRHLWETKPCVIFTSEEHAVAVCAKGNVHDPDEAFVVGCSSWKDLRDWLSSKAYRVEVVYKAVLRQDRRSLSSNGHSKQLTNPGKSRRAQRRRKKKSEALE
jgi:hypothetical protein